MEPLLVRGGLTRISIEDGSGDRTGGTILGQLTSVQSTTLEVLEIAHIPSWSTYYITPLFYRCHNLRRLVLRSGPYQGDHHTCFSPELLCLEPWVCSSLEYLELDLWYKVETGVDNPLTLLNEWNKCDDGEMELDPNWTEWQDGSAFSNRGIQQCWSHITKLFQQLRQLQKLAEGGGQPGGSLKLSWHGNLVQVPRFYLFQGMKGKMTEQDLEWIGLLDCEQQ